LSETTDAHPRIDGARRRERRPPLRTRLELAARELVFRVACRHRQGPRPNILLHCARRGGSTWLLNTLAAHPGMRYVGRPLLTIPLSRWWHRLPDLAAAAGVPDSDHPFRQVVHFEGDDERRFLALCREIFEGRLHVYPTLAFRAPYFHRVTDRIVFQMTSGPPLIEWFDRELDVMTAILFRHPIPCARSVLASSRTSRHDGQDFLLHEWFVDTHLTGAQVDLARGIIAGDDTLAQQVLDWTLKMLMPFRAAASCAHPAWAVVTYEQMVTEPIRVIEAISERLDLTDVETMREQMDRPSRTVSQTTADHVGDVNYLLGRWREDTPPERERELLAIPLAFDLDLYEPGRLTADVRFSV